MDSPENLEARRQENIAVFNANRTRIVDSTIPNMTLLITENRGDFEQEGQLTDEDIALGSRWLSEILYGIHVVYNLGEIPEEKRRYQYTFPPSNTKYPEPVIKKPPSPTYTPPDNPQLLRYLGATLEYSALATKRSVAAKCFQDQSYARRLSKLMEGAERQRQVFKKESADNGGPIPNGDVDFSPDLEVSILVSSDGRYVLNPRWLTALIHQYRGYDDPEVSLEASGMVYNTMEDAMFFIGIEEGSHFIEQMNRSYRFKEKGE